MTVLSPGKTILVVDDDDITRAGFEHVLHAHGYTVVQAASGRKALAYLRDHPAPDLIILDMLMEDIDGWTFLKSRDAQWFSIPVLITTELSIASDEWALALGASAWLQKPIDEELMLKAVGKYVRSG